MNGPYRANNLNNNSCDPAPIQTRPDPFPSAEAPPPFFAAVSTVVVECNVTITCEGDAEEARAAEI